MGIVRASSSFFGATALLFICGSVVGCGKSHTGDGGDAGNRTERGRDGGSGRADGANGVQCGSAICGDGLECCNASCGICAPPGVSCPAIGCVDAGREQDGGGALCGAEACGAGETCCHVCGTAFCQQGGPNECPVADCAPLFESCEQALYGGGYEGAACVGEWMCEETDDACCVRYASCNGGSLTMARTCTRTCQPGCATNAECGPGSYCELGRGCGGPGTCQPFPDVCPGDCGVVCGCNGRQYCNSCQAARAGVSMAHDGPCTVPVPPGDCEAQDARVTGGCDLPHGIYWDGSQCASLSGCSCHGSDCGNGYMSLEACERAHAHCGGRRCGGWAGDTCGPSEFCDFAMDYCDWTDASGVCRPRPQGCDDIYDPVCGCNGMTYSNECDAQAAGQDAAYHGECGIALDNQ